MHITTIKTSIFKKNDSLDTFIKAHIPTLQEGDVVVITSKIVALSEGRLGKVEDKEKIIVRESKEVIQIPWAYLTRMNDGWGINAGVDESNADAELILLPKNPNKTAEVLLHKLKKYYSIQKLGILITDTRSVPLRVGTIGRAIGYAGFKPLKNYIGKDDLFGRKSRVTQSNIPDALAASATFVMGEGNEQTPLAVVSGAPIQFTSKALSEKMKHLSLSPEKDIFSQIYKKTKE